VAFWRYGMAGQAETFYTRAHAQRERFDEVSCTLVSDFMGTKSGGGITWA